MPVLALTTQQDSPWVRESPVIMIEGESRSFNLTVIGATTVTSPATTGYNAEAVASPTITSGSDSVTASAPFVITTKVIGAVKGGETYVLSIQATVDGRTDVYLCKIEVLFPYGQGSQ